MSEYFRPTRPIPLDTIRRKCRGISVEVSAERSVFREGESFLHFQVNKSGEVIDVFRYGRNEHKNILRELEEHCDVEMVSEYADEGVLYDSLADPDTLVRVLNFEDSKINGVEVISGFLVDVDGKITAIDGEEDGQSG